MHTNKNKKTMSNKVKAYATTSGKLFVDREQYVRAEIEEMIGRDEKGNRLVNLEEFLDALMAFREPIRELLHVRKPREAKKV